MPFSRSYKHYLVLLFLTLTYRKFWNAEGNENHIMWSPD